MGCKVIALFNQAGGVGKTTITQNLGYHLSLLNQKILLIDLDPQSSLSHFMNVDTDSLEVTPYNALIEEQPLQIIPDIYGVDLVATNISLSAAEIQLVNLDFREVRLKEAIEPLLDAYDYILIDCPPSLGLLSYSALIASTHVLIPIETHFKAFQGTNLLLETISRVKKRGNKNLVIAGFIPSRYSKTNSQDQRTLKAIQEEFSSIAQVYEPIPRLTAFVDASEEGLPLAKYEPKSLGVEIFKNLASSIHNEL